jgi:hypothetical protein
MPALLLLLIAVTGLLGGCATAPPRAYDAPVNLADFARELKVPDEGYLLFARATEGRFPCTLAVSKLTTRQDPFGCGVMIYECGLEPAEQARWTTTFRGSNQVRDLVFLTPITLQPAEADRSARCVTADRLGAPLLLEYVANQLGPNSAELTGIIYDTATCEVLATLNVYRVQTDAKGIEQPPGVIAEERAVADARPFDAFHQAREVFHQAARAAVQELVALDNRPERKEQHRWGVRLPRSYDSYRTAIDRAPALTEASE